MSIRKFNNIQVLNLAYRISSEFQRKGFVFEACGAIIEEAEKVFTDIPIMVLTKRNNMPSFKLAQKLGFIYYPEYDGYPEKDDIYLFNIFYESKRIALKKL